MSLSLKLLIHETEECFPCGVVLRIKEKKNASKLISTLPGRKLAPANHLMYEKHPLAYSGRHKEDKHNECSLGVHNLVETMEIH